MIRSAIPIATLVLCLFAAIAAAQTNPGDYIIGNQSGVLGTSILATTPGSNTLRTIAVLPANQNLRGVLVGPFNTEYFAASGLSVYKADAGGQVTTLVTALPIGVGTCWADLDETGDLLVGTGWANNGALFRLDLKGNLLTTMMPNTFPNVFCLDRDSGEIVVGESGSRMILRIQRDGTITSVATSPGTPYAMDYHPPSGNVLLGTTSRIYAISPSNQVSTFANVPMLVKSMAVAGDGSVTIGSNGGTTMLRYDASGNLLGTVYTGPAIKNVCMVIDGEHTLWGLNQPTLGNVFSLSVRFANLPGRAYVTAASFAPRPGFTVNGHHVPLNPDNLFAASVAIPQIFVNFRGVLDTGGRAFPLVMLPRVAALRGLRVFFATVVVDPNTPSGIGAVSQEYGVTIQ